MAKFGIKNIMIVIFLSTSLLLAVFAFIQMLYIQELEGDIALHKDEVAEAESTAYQDCQRFMQIETTVQRVNGCYATLEELCGRTKKPLSCMEELVEVCTKVRE